MAPRVLIADALSEAALAVFKARGLEVDVAVGLTPDELLARIAHYDGLAVRSATKATAEILAVAPRLKVIGRAGIGVDNIDVAAATARGVVVMNTPHGNAITTAEHAIAMMFSLARDIPAADRSTRASKWEKSRFMGVEVTGKTLGVIGCGNIGAIVAERALGLKMRVLAYDPYLSDQRAADLGVRKVALDELLTVSDFITLHVPLTEQTKNLIDAAALAKMKKGVRLINCARGGLVVEKDLLTALQSGQVAGAALDVFEVEPAKDNALFALEQVVCTPHLGASTAEAQEKVALQVAEQISDYLLTGAITNAVNMPSLTAEEARRLGPYMALAQQLGAFAGQLTETGIKAVRLEYEGQAAGLNTRPLTQIALAAFLRPMLETVNNVNAPAVARERGIEVSEVKHSREGDYQTLLRLTVTTERRQRSIAGTLFGGQRPRLVEVKGIPIEAELVPHMLYVTNQDQPGFIGAIGSLLGEGGVNISTFHLGRAEQGGEAVALIGLDAPLSTLLLNRVRALPQIRQATPLRF